MEGSGACVFRWILSEPLHDAGHFRLEGARDGEVEHSRSSMAAVLEVVSDAARNQHERSPCGMSPVPANEHAHRALDDVKDVIFGVRVCTWSLSVGFQPPFRDRVAGFGFRPIGLEERAYAAHRIRTTLARAEDHSLPRRRVGFVHRASDVATWKTATESNKHSGAYKRVSSRANALPRIRLKKPTNRKSPTARANRPNAKARQSHLSHEPERGDTTKWAVAATNSAHAARPTATKNVAKADGTNAGRLDTWGTAAPFPVRPPSAQ